MKQKEKYEAPCTACTEVELESGLLKASIFEPENNHDDDLKIEGHEVGNQAIYDSWDFEEDNNLFK